MQNELTRKNIRLKEYDYSRAGYYFITICVKDGHEMLGSIAVGAATCRPYVKLSDIGKTVKDSIENIHGIYLHVSVDKYVIMPNHVHMILRVAATGDGRQIAAIGDGRQVAAIGDGRQVAAPTAISTVIGNMKRYVSMQCGFSIWQKSFHDHIIRNEADYRRIWRYIDENPARWTEDKYYVRENNTMTINELLTVCNEIAPPDCVWSGDNVGLLVDREGGVDRVLVALDVTLAVIGEAKELGAQVIISHHPVIFEPLKSVTYANATGRRVMALIKNNIACICMHTNYDGAQNGINDRLARLAGIVNPEILVNQDGKYGRFGLLEAPAELMEYAAGIKLALGGAAVRAHDAGRPVHKVCVGSGSSGGILSHAIGAGCDTFITGDVRHDVFCEARDMGINLIDAGHFATEDIMCELLIGELSVRAPRLKAVKALNSLKPYSEVF